MKFSAMLHGADPKSLEDKKMSSVKKDNSTNLLFGDPEEYKNWSEEKREEVSSMMMKKFVNWAGAKNG